MDVTRIARHPARKSDPLNAGCTWRAAVTLVAQKDGVLRVRSQPERFDRTGTLVWILRATEKREMLVPVDCKAATLRRYR